MQARYDLLEVQNGRLYCVTCNTQIDYELTSKLRASNNRQHERELLENRRRTRKDRFLHAHIDIVQ